MQIGAAECRDAVLFHTKDHSEILCHTLSRYIEYDFVAVIVLIYKVDDVSIIFEIRYKILK